MGKVIRAKSHLTVEEMDAQLKSLHDFWRIRRWLVIRHALVAPAPAQEIALRLGLSVCTVRDLIEAYNRHGPQALETAGKGQRQRAYLSFEAERTFLASFIAASQAGHIAVARVIKKAFEEPSGRRVAPSTIYRLLHRHHWRKVVPRPKNPRSSQEEQDTFKKTLETKSSKSSPRVMQRIPVPCFSWRKMRDVLG
jgi:transposase